MEFFETLWKIFNYLLCIRRSLYNRIVDYLPSISYEYDSEACENDKCLPPSLINVGANCYLNSAFQGISSCDTFVKDVKDLCKTYPIGKIEKLDVFKELIDILNGHSNGEMDISRNPIFRHWNKPGQQDSYELLAYAMNQVYNEIRSFMETENRIPRRDLQRWLKIRLPMRFIIDYTIHCGCGSISHSPLQSDLAFHVTINRNEKNLELQRLMDLYFDEDPIEDYECDRKYCKGVNAVRQARLCNPLPRTVCIHLQRTFWNGFYMVKINDRVSFDTTLTLKSKYRSKMEFVNGEEKGNTENYKDPDHGDTKVNVCDTEVLDGGEDIDNCDDNIERFLNVFIENILKEEILKLENTKSTQIIINETNQKGLDELKTDFKDNGRLKVMNEDDNEDERGGIKDTVCDDKKSFPLKLKGCTEKEQTYKEDNDCRHINGYQESPCDSRGDILEHKDNEIDILSYATNNTNERDEQQQLNNEDDNSVLYHLVSVIVHYGSFEFGHYVCYKRIDNNWFLTNDSLVTRVSEEEVLRSQAYILFYEQEHKTTTK